MDEDGQDKTHAMMTEMDESGRPRAAVVQSPRGKSTGGSLLWKVATGVLLLVCIALAVALGVVVGGDVKPCGTGMAVEVVADGPPGVFDDLTAEEVKAARDYMLGVTALDIKPLQEATFYDNYLYTVELHLPPKTEALAYLDNNGPLPVRQALVTVYANSMLAIEQYVVGPLPNPTRHSTYAPAGRKDPIPWHSRNPDSKETTLRDEVIRQATKQIDSILAESFDGYKHNDCGERCLIAMDSAIPRGFQSGERLSWHRFNRAMEGFWLHPLPCAIQSNHSDPDHTKWQILQVFYNEQYFPSIDDFVQQYNSGNVQKITVTAPTGDAAKYSSFTKHGSPQHPSQPLRGPELIEPDGRRYKVTGRHIEYMGWSFDWRLAATSGPHLFDVRMNGERIIYELAMKEIGTWYSGKDPTMITAQYVDAGLPGGGNYELVRGIDCPTTATFFDTVSMLGAEGPVVYKNSVCVFELNTGIPLRRHYESNYFDGHWFYGGLVDNALVLRTIQTVGNYDFVHDFIFHQNGVLEVKASLTGYVQSTYYHSSRSDYGFPAWGGNMANLHQHFFNYKVDLDVGGTANRFETVDITVDNIENPQRPGERHYLTRFQRNQKTTESQATVQYDFTQPKYYNFYSETAKNRFGVHRGYRIQLNGISKNLLPKDQGATMVNGGAWVDYQVAVTRRKESEPSSSSVFNQNDMYDPVVNFQSFIDDDENIVDEDLVAWVTTSAHHIPHSEDFPSTATPANQLQFFIRPFHFYDQDPSAGSSNIVLLTRSPGSSENYVDRYGTPEMATCEPKHTPFSYDGRWHNV